MYGKGFSFRGDWSIMGIWNEEIRTKKYEQNMNRPKNCRKTAVFRIVWQIPAKIRLGSQYLQGFPEGTVEMRKARLGHWHICTSNSLAIFSDMVEMRKARLGHWHTSWRRIVRSTGQVEMRKARLGHWHPAAVKNSLITPVSRNEKSPLRALTHSPHDASSQVVPQ